MSETTSQPNRNRFPTFKRVFNWRVIRAGLFVLACLITLIALFYAEENWRGARAKRACERELEAKGARLDYRQFVPPPVPNEQNFAATPFLAPLFDFNPTPLQPGQTAWRDTNAWRQTMDFAKDFPDLSKHGNWRAGVKMDLPACRAEFQKARRGHSAGTDTAEPTPTKQADVAGWAIAELKQYDAVLEELRAASQRPHSRFNLQYDMENPAGILLPHLARIKVLCQILRFRGVAELQLGHFEAAARDVDLMLYLADSIKGEPILISQLVRMACLDLTLQVVWEGLMEHRWSEAQLRAWQTRFERFDFVANLDFALRAERAWHGKVIDWAKANQSNNGYGELSGYSSESQTADDRAVWAFRVCPRGWYDLEKCNFYRASEDYLFAGYDPRARRIYPGEFARSQAGLEKFMNDSSSPILSHRVFVRLLIPALDGVNQRFAQAQATVDQASVACALERYHLANGNDPKTLDELVPRFIERLPRDVITGEPLKYLRSADGQFTLYSVGWNEKDDGGRIVLNKNGAPDIAQGDWVWQTRAAKP